MDDGTLLEWRVAVGDEVHKGDIMALVDTDKSAIEVEIFFDGVIEELVAEPGEKLPVGAVLAKVRTEGEGEAPDESRRPKASPAARRRARELGVNLAGVIGSGPGGAIQLADIEAAAPAEKPEPTEDRGDRIRKAIAAAMARSNDEIPHYYLSTTFSMANALAFIDKHNATAPITERVLPAALLVKATALALVEVPELNGFWKNGALEKSKAIHVGMAISIRGGGVVVPAVHHANERPLGDVMASLRDLVSRARRGGLKSSELSEGTVTITSLGERAPDTVYGVVFPPQVALVGFGSIVERPWVVDGEVVPHSVLTATLAADHRATDGHLGGRLLTAVERLLQEPERLS
jgi:pyruvate dehydrogenase E2 component (dihydrolipoamide acetyltransferase)